MIPGPAHAVRESLVRSRVRFVALVQATLRVVGALVAEAQKSGRPLRETAAKGLKETSPAVAARLDQLFDPDEAVRAKSLPGGTAPEAVRVSLAGALEALEG